MKLNLGSGPCYLEGWINTDIRKDMSWDVDQYWDFTKRIPLKDETVDMILAWHIVEHIPMQDLGGVFEDWFRVLKRGGKVFIGCPDMGKIAKHIVDRDGAWNEWYICMVNVFGPYNGSVGDLHRWGYNFDELGKKLNNAGFVGYRGLDRNTLFGIIGAQHSEKIGFADYNLQIMAEKPN